MTFKLSGRVADSTTSMAERRMSDRKNIVVHVTLNSDTNFYTGFTTDISEGGVFVSTPYVRPIGTHLQLRLVINNRIINVQCEVRWIRELHEYDSETPPGMGLRFLNLPDEEKTRINEFIEGREPIFFPTT